MFGHAGSPVNYKGAAYKAPKYIKEEGLDSYEYQSPYGVRIGEKSAKILKEESEKHDILISMHVQTLLYVSFYQKKVLMGNYKIPIALLVLAIDFSLSDSISSNARIASMFSGTTSDSW